MKLKIKIKNYSVNLYVNNKNLMKNYECEMKQKIFKSTK